MARCAQVLKEAETADATLQDEASCELVDAGFPEVMPSAGSVSGVFDVFVGALPPPITGQAVVSRAVVDLISSASGIRVINTSPGGLSRNLRYHAARVLKVIHALIYLLWLRVSAFVAGRSSAGSLYTVYESGYGVFYSILLVLCARALRFRIYMHHHTSAHTVGHRAGASLFFRLLGARAVHVVLSDRMKDDLTRLYRGVVHVEVCLNARHVASGIAGVEVSCESSQRVTLGHLSNVSIDKGFATVCEVFRSLCMSGLDVHLRVAGPICDDASMRLHEMLLEQHADRYVYEGPVSGLAKDRFFNGIDLFLFPTQYRFEAQPMVILESLARGVPVVAFDRGYISEMLDPEFICRADDGPAFLAAARRLCEMRVADCQSFHLLRRRALRLFEAQFRLSCRQVDGFVDRFLRGA